METLSDSIPRHADNDVDVESDGGFLVTGLNPVVVAELAARFDPSGLDGDSLLTVLGGTERIIAALHAMQVKAMAAFSRLSPATREEPFGELVADEIALELSVTRNAAENRVAQAVVMTTRVPVVLHALEVSATTLAGADDKPGVLDGYGPVPAAFARKIAADPTGVWRRLVTDPVDGSLIEHSRNTYRPPAALNDFVRARDGKCRFPGCQRSARHADLDHTIPWPKGPTTAGSLGALCRTHHRLKHQTTWRLTQDNGRFCWTSPTGRRYITEPENHDPP